MTNSPCSVGCHGQPQKISQVCVDIPSLHLSAFSYDVGKVVEELLQFGKARLQSMLAFIFKVTSSKTFGSLASSVIFVKWRTLGQIVPGHRSFTTSGNALLTPFDLGDRTYGARTSQKCDAPLQSICVYVSTRR